MANAKEQKWELTAYESQRKPQKIFVTDIESAVIAKCLHTELMCPICLSILKKTMTTKDCLHRFCYDCIITALRSGNKECPTCRKKLISKRSLRPDDNFDLLIAKIYPDLAKYEAEHEQAIAKLNSAYMQTLAENPLNESRQTTARNDDKNEGRMRKRRKYWSMSENLPNFNCDDDTEVDLTLPTNSGMGEILLEEIEMIFKPHPSTTLITNDESRYIKTTASASVDHLRKYLTLRLNLDRELNRSAESNIETNLDPDNVRIYIGPSSDQLTLLNGPETLEELKHNFGENDRPLHMYYLLTEV